MIRRMPRAGELEVLLGGRELIAIENDLDVAAVTRHAAEHFVLTALAEFSQIGVSAVWRGHAGVVLLDPRAHFLDQRFLQTAGVPEQAFGIVVLRFEIFSDIRVEYAVVAQ